MMDVGRQSNGSSCGVLAIAFAFDICSGNDSCKIKYDHKSIRQHLADCLEKCCLSRFPMVGECRTMGVRHTQSVDLHCTSHQLFSRTCHVCLCNYICLSSPLYICTRISLSLALSLSLSFSPNPNPNLLLSTCVFMCISLSLSLPFVLLVSSLESCLNTSKYISMASLCLFLLNASLF